MSNARYNDLIAKLLTPKFFNRPTLEIAKDLLGKLLVRKYRGKRLSLMITEVEAYDGPRDLASHASRGRTLRNAPMFGKGGRFYVYFTYGMHWMLNIVTGKEGYPAAVLLRGGKHFDSEKKSWIVVTGPARLTKYLKIDKKFNGKSADRRTGLWFEDRGIKVKSSQIKLGPRVGVDYAGSWTKKKYNFQIKPVPNHR